MLFQGQLPLQGCLGLLFLLGLAGCGPTPIPVSDGQRKTLPGPMRAGDFAAKSPAAKTGPSEEVRLEVVKFGQFKEILAKLKGKIVVVDVWADYCVPCKKEFPNLVAMHRQYAGAGVACISLALDEKADQEKPLKFLKEQKAAFANYLLDEETTGWQEHLGIAGPPTVFVYDRDGKQVGKIESKRDVEIYDVVGKLVKQLLDKKS